MKEILLSNNEICLVDDDFYEVAKVYRWQAQKSHPNKPYGAYAVKKIPHPDGLKSSIGKTKVKHIRMHREIMNAKDGEIIDHIDGNTLNNQRSNLRFATAFQNQGNRKLSKNSKTGYKGVKLGYNGTFVAYIHHKRKPKYLGTFKTKEDAAKAYNAAALKQFGEFAFLNKIKE